MADQEPTEAAHSVRSVERALDLLAMLGAADRPLGVRELERLTGIPRATVQRLLSVLERRHLARNEGGRYRLGVGVVALARSFLAGDSLAQAALPVLERLARASGETASLYVRQGFKRVVVQRVESAHSLRYTLRIGERLPLHVGAAGRVLAAAMPEGELHRLLERVSEGSLAADEPLAGERLLASIEEIRRRGYAVSLGERVEGVVSVAAPVPAPGEATLAAVAISGPPGRMTPERIEQLAEEVRRAAREIAGAGGRSGF